MGVYVKGMKMPKNCLECMNSGFRTAIGCTEWTEISAGLRENHRAISCHLTEVTEPHGRLSDMDELLDKVRCADWHISYCHDGTFLDVSEFAYIVRNIATVIEAEGE